MLRTSAAPALSAQRPVLASAQASPEELAAAIRIAARFVPRSTCLVRALAAQKLFADYGHESTLRIGVARPDGSFAAHAWLEHAGREIVGRADGYTPVHTVESTKKA